MLYLKTLVYYSLHQIYSSNLSWGCQDMSYDFLTETYVLWVVPFTIQCGRGLYICKETIY